MSSLVPAISSESFLRRVSRVKVSGSRLSPGKSRPILPAHSPLLVPEDGSISDELLIAEETLMPLNFLAGFVALGGVISLARASKGSDSSSIMPFKSISLEIWRLENSWFQDALLKLIQSLVSLTILRAVSLPGVIKFPLLTM